MLTISANRFQNVDFKRNLSNSNKVCSFNEPSFGHLRSINKPLNAINISAESIKYIEPFKKQYNFKNKKSVQWALKRASDYVGATAAIVLTSPIMALSAAAIKLESKGPILFKQNRLGKDGKSFVMYKFRNMHDSAPKTYFKMDPVNDPHVTKVGRFLRKYSIDELPQLFNVLKGDMSLIGPRPLIDVSEMERLDPEMARRFVVRPGAKLDYKAMKNENLSEKINTEKEYLDNWSLKSDFKVLCKIVRDMVTGRNY